MAADFLQGPVPFAQSCKNPRQAAGTDSPFRESQMHVHGGY